MASGVLWLRLWVCYAYGYGYGRATPMAKSARVGMIWLRRRMSVCTKATIGYYSYRGGNVVPKLRLFPALASDFANTSYSVRWHSFWKACSVWSISLSVLCSDWLTLATATGILQLWLWAYCSYSYECTWATATGIWLWDYYGYGCTYNRRTLILLRILYNRAVRQWCGHMRYTGTENGKTHKFNGMLEKGKLQS